MKIELLKLIAADCEANTGCGFGEGKLRLDMGSWSVQGLTVLIEDDKANPYLLVIDDKRRSIYVDPAAVIAVTSSV